MTADEGTRSSFASGLNDCPGSMGDDGPSVEGSVIWVDNGMATSMSCGVVGSSLGGLDLAGALGGLWTDESGSDAILHIGIGALASGWGAGGGCTQCRPGRLMRQARR